MCNIWFYLFLKLSCLFMQSHWKVPVPTAWCFYTVACNIYIFITCFTWTEKNKWNKCQHLFNGRLCDELNFAIWFECVRDDKRHWHCCQNNLVHVEDFWCLTTSWPMCKNVLTCRFVGKETKGALYSKYRALCGFRVCVTPAPWQRGSI